MFSKLKGFLRGQNGNVGLLFALSVIPMFALAGGVIDYAYVQDERQKLQNALDSAVLAAMRGHGGSPDMAQRIVKDYLLSNYSPGERVQFQPGDVQVSLEGHGSSSQLTATIDVSVRMPFWSLVGVSTYKLRVLSQARQGVGGLEVVMVLDTTLSMEWATYAPAVDDVVVKIEELKTAAKSLVNELSDIASNSTMGTVKVGLVPYSLYVRLDPNRYSGASWLDMSYFNERAPGTQWEGYIGLRPQPYDILDGDYGSVGIPAIPKLWRIDGSEADLDTDTRTFDQGVMIPLVDVSDSTAVSNLTSAIDALTPNGWTYIPAGLVWGWRMLTAQEPFSEATPHAQARSNNIEKIIILMTDGVNTCQHEQGPLMECKHAWENGSPDAPSRMLQLCDNIKADGIKIITIAYDISDDNQHIRDLMRSCSNAGHYEPMAGDLINVFSNIANRVKKLHLSQ